MIARGNILPTGTMNAHKFSGENNITTLWGDVVEGNFLRGKQEAGDDTFQSVTESWNRRK